MGVLAGINTNSAHLNPAAVFAFSVISNTWNGHWIWWISSILGALFGLVLVRMFFAPICSRDDESISPLWWWRVYLYKQEKEKYRHIGHRRSQFEVRKRFSAKVSP